MDSSSNTPATPAPDSVNPESAAAVALAAASARSRSMVSARKSPPLSRRERYVLWAALPVVVLCPWHAGSMLWWSNSLNAALALLPVIVAFMVPLTEELAEQSAEYSCWQNFKNLLKFPVFWLGLFLIGYVLIQALNYNWEFKWTENKRGFYMQMLEDDQYIHWLPSGMQSPFKMTSPWQALLSWLAPWLVVCAMWSTLRRRKAWCVVLWAVSVTGALLAILGIAAQITAPDKIFWIWDGRWRNPFGPYTYRNQGSVLLYMALASSVALYFYYQRTQSRDSGIQWFALLLGMLSLGGSIMSFSRAGWIGTAAVVLAAVFLFVIRILWQLNENPKLLIAQGAILFALLGGGAYFASKLDFSEMEGKWHRLTNQIRGEEAEGDRGFELRKAVAKKTLVMFEDNKWTGWGANSFRFYFPVYQQGDDFITQYVKNGRVLKRYRLFWTHAHSDWAQILAEYGIIGSSFLALGLLYWLGSMLVRIGSLHCEHWILMAAAVTMFAQASLDIVFYNPSLVIFFAVILCAARGLVQPRKHPVRRAEQAL